MTIITKTPGTSEEPTPVAGNLKSADFFKTLIENTRDVTAVLDADGCVRYISPSAEVKFSMPIAEISGKCLFDFIHPDDRETISASFKELVTSHGASIQIQFRILHNTGVLKYFEAGFKNLLKDDTVGGIIVNMRDITERKKAEDALRQSEARYRTVAETASDAIVTVDHNSTILFANRSTAKIFGYRIEELVGNNLNILMPEYLRALHARGMQRHIDTGEKHIPWEAVEVPGLHKNGHEIPLEISFGKFIDNGQHIFTGIIRDISERKLTESKLAMRDNAMDMASEGIMITDALFSDNPLVYVNRGFEQITGYSKEEVIGKNGMFLEGPETDLDTAAEIYSIIRAKKPGKVEILNYKKDGTPFWNLLSLTPLKNSEGTVTNYIAIQTDITERKRIEEQLQEAFKKERELSDMKSHFITTASHEFRTPLSAIISSAEILEHYNDKISEDKRFVHLKKIQSGARAITDILEKILDYNKAEEGRLGCSPREISISDLCSELIDATLHHYHTCSVSFKNESGSDYAVLDTQLIYPALENILSNACKFSHTGGSIDFLISRRDGAFIFTVRDNGIGIPHNDLERIAEPFHRGTNAGNIPGVGLGLAVAKRMIEIHNGSLKIESALDGGTTVTIQIPDGPVQL